MSTAGTWLPAVCTPLHRQHDPVAGFKREHGRSGEAEQGNTLFSPEVGRSHSSGSACNGHGAKGSGHQSEQTIKQLERG